MKCVTCGQPVQHKHVSDGDWSEPFTDINHRTFMTSQCRICKRLMTREITEAIKLCPRSYTTAEKIIAAKQITETSISKAS